MKLGRKKAYEASEWDPAVPLVEQLLTSAAASLPEVLTAPQTPTSVARALWICACISKHRAPSWLLAESLDGELSWSRVANSVEMTDIVRSDLAVGGHADPSYVLAWAKGEVPDLFGEDDYFAGENVTRVLQVKLLSSQVN